MTVNFRKFNQILNPVGVAVGGDVWRQAHPGVPQRARLQAAPARPPRQAAQGDDRRNERQARAADRRDGANPHQSGRGAVIQGLLKNVIILFSFAKMSKNPTK